MKSAYEIAMEKLQASSGPSKSLTDEQKARIAEIDTKYDAKAAETKLGYDEKLSGVPYAEVEEIRKELSVELARIEEKRESEKEAVWEEASE